LLAETRANLESAVRRLDALEETTAGYGELPVRQALIEDRQTRSEERQGMAEERHTAVSDEAHLAAINSELLKGEVRQLRGAIDELGFAIAPAAGLEGAKDRLSELRARVNGLDRRIRHLASSAQSGKSSALTTTSTARSEPQARPEAAALSADERPPSALFDYAAFERRFRGDSDELTETLWSRYGSLLLDQAPVLDVGCGAGQLIGRLQQAGVIALGVDTDPSMVAEARAQGLTVHQEDANSFLQGQPEHSLGAIVATQLVEHLPLDALMRLLELSMSRLRPGGIFVAETPNPQSLIVLGNTYVIDPTHVRPVHPSLLVFLCESVGFRDVRLEFFAPLEAYHLAPVDAPGSPDFAEQINKAFERLNKVLFGPQDYAAIATTPS
jgi:SAM-dependent methyltransferase